MNPKEVFIVNPVTGRSEKKFVINGVPAEPRYKKSARKMPPQPIKPAAPSKP